MRVQDGYTRVDVAHDIRLIREQAVEGLRRRLGRPRAAARRADSPTQGDPNAGWKAQAQMWIDELLCEVARPEETSP